MWREVTWSWKHPGTLCERLALGITLERKAGLQQAIRQRASREEDKAWKKTWRLRKSILGETVNGVMIWCPFTSFFWNTSSLLPDIRAATGPRPADQTDAVGRVQWLCPTRRGESNWFVRRRSQLSPPAWLQQVCSWELFASLKSLNSETSYNSLFSWNGPSFCGILGGICLECFQKARPSAHAGWGWLPAALLSQSRESQKQHPQPGEGAARKWTFLEMGLHFLTESLPSFPRVRMAWDHVFAFLLWQRSTGALMSKMDLINEGARQILLFLLRGVLS